MDWWQITRDLYLEKGSHGQIKNWTVKVEDELALSRLGLLGKLTKKNGTYQVKVWRIFKQLGVAKEDIFPELEVRYGKLLSQKDQANQINTQRQTAFANFLTQLDAAPKEFFLSLDISPRVWEKQADFYQNALQMWSRPSQPTLLAAYALKIFSNPHALDYGRKERNFLEKLLVAQYGPDARLDDHNLYQDQLANFVGTANLLVSPLNFDLISLADVTTVDLPRGQNIYLHENSGVTTVLARRYPDRKFVCTAGQPTLACRLLITRLLAADNTLYYSGDLDQTGLKIADNLLQDFPALKLKNMDLETYYKYQKQAVVPSKDRHIKQVQHPVLQSLLTAIQSEGKIIFEEAIHELL